MAVTGEFSGRLAGLLASHETLVVVTGIVAVFIPAVSRRLITARLR